MMLDSPSDRSNVAIDIETCGFGARERVTVVGFLPPDRHCSVVLNAGGRSVDGAHVAGRVAAAADHPVDVAVADDERDLLASLARVVFDRVDRPSNRLVAYNGETWNGGFDLPFLRTRCARLGVDWPLDGCAFTDVSPLVRRRFNTADGSGTAGDGGRNDLVTAHRLLCEPAREFDPLPESAAAVECFHAGEFVPLVQHNVSDVHRTLDLAELACRYVPARYFDDYKL